MPNRDLSTGEIARLLRVSVCTVIDWIETGLLPSYNVPGSKYRRITRANFFSFLKRHSVPIELVCPRRPPIAVFDPNGHEYADHLQRELVLTRTKVVGYPDFFSLGTAIRELAPGMVVLDLRRGNEKPLGDLSNHVERIRQSLAQPYRALVVDIVETKELQRKLLALPRSVRPDAVLAGRAELSAVVNTSVGAFIRAHANLVVSENGQPH